MYINWVPKHSVLEVLLFSSSQQDFLVEKQTHLMASKRVL